MKLVLVEDDDGVADALVEALNVRGHDTDRKRWGRDLLVSHRDYDAVILDLGLPDVDGLQLLRQLREVSAIPVVILTANGDERTMVRGLRLGADDYVVKPPRVGELSARLEAVSRRAAVAAGVPEDVVVTGDVRVDLRARRVELAGEVLPLTQKEFELVAVLTERPGTAVSRQQLMDRIWGDAFVAVSRTLDVHMTTLRAKINRPGLITTIRGYGYRWGD